MLYFIPTPIGNKEDITMRALRLLKELSIVICEDTRTTKKLLSMYDIDYKDKQFHSLTSYTKTGQLDHYVKLLQQQDVGVVSEAGTPGLSDPGKILIKLCQENNITYSVLPGANALIPAIVSAAFDTSQFMFIGFLPTKKGRQTALKQAISANVPVFFYESVHRMEKLVDQLLELGFDGQLCIAREISKMYEQLITADIQTMKAKIADGSLPLKGEFVVGVRN